MTSTYHLLIVEDEIEIANIEQLALEDLPVNIHHCSNPADGLTYLAENAPALLVLDIGLPGMTGWQFLEKVKADKLLPEDVPVVITTAFSDPANRVIGKLQNVTHYLTKPFSPMEFRDLVVSVLQLDG